MSAERNVDVRHDGSALEAQKWVGADGGTIAFHATWAGGVPRQRVNPHDVFGVDPHDVFENPSMKAMLREYWLLIAGVVVISVTIGLITLSGRPGVYVSNGTYVVRPTSSSDEEIIRATLGLTDATKVEATYAYIVESDLIVDRARSRISMIGGDDEAVSVDAATVPGADMLTISALSRNAELAYRMAVAVGEEAADYVESFDALFSLVPLDEPTVPTVPSGFDGQPLILVATAGLGLLLSAGAAILLDYWFGRYWRLRGQGGVWGDLATDDPEYTKLRLLEEMSRADSSGVPFDIAIIDNGRGSGLPNRNSPKGHAFHRRVVDVVRPTLRPYQHIGPCGFPGGGTATAILPGLTADEIARLREEWLTSLQPPSPLGTGRVNRLEIVDCRYERGTFVGSPAAVHVAERLAR